MSSRPYSRLTKDTLTLLGAQVRLARKQRGMTEIAGRLIGSRQAADWKWPQDYAPAAPVIEREVNGSELVSRLQFAFKGRE